MEGMGEAMQRLVRAKSKQDTLAEVEDIRHGGNEALDDYMREQHAHCSARIKAARRKIEESLEA